MHGSRFFRDLPPPVTLSVLFLAAALAVLTVLLRSDAAAAERFDLWRWERVTVANKWLSFAGRPLRDEGPAELALIRYFEPSASESTRRALENQVEAVIEGRIDRVLGSLGIDALLPVPAVTFPPVDIELAASPHVLVISPRDRIERIETRFLSPYLSAGNKAALERRVEADGDLSAIVARTGGLASYPAVVAEGRSYRATIATAAHEWVHHYLSFYPLGRRYNHSSDLRVINEAVADVAGDEIARLVVADWGEPEGTASASRVGSSLTPPYERLRALRLLVDDLLATGRINQAEARMGEVREELCDAGYCLRRINQAYFAWYGTYATRPDSVDRLGHQIRELLEHSTSLGAFLRAVRNVGSRSELEELWRSKVPAGTNPDSS